MLEQVAAYLRKLGYTVEEQGTIEKYLVVFGDGKPLGFILSDCTMRLVTNVDGADEIKDAIGFLQNNRDLPPVGNGEYLLASHRKNQVTVFFDVKNRLIRYTVYLVDRDTGEVCSTVYESHDDAMYRLVTESHMIDHLQSYLPQKKTLSGRIREKLLRYLLSKSNQQPERQ